MVLVPHLEKVLVPPNGTPSSIRGTPFLSGQLPHTIGTTRRFIPSFSKTRKSQGSMEMTIGMTMLSTQVARFSQGIG